MELLFTDYNVNIVSQRLEWIADCVKFAFESGISIADNVNILGYWSIWDIIVALFVFSMSFTIISTIFGLVHFEHEEVIKSTTVDLDNGKVIHKDTTRKGRNSKTIKYTSKMQ